VDGGIMVGEKDGSPRVEESYAKQGYHPWSRTKIFLQKILTKEMNKCNLKMQNSKEDVDIDNSLNSRQNSFIHEQVHKLLSLLQDMTIVMSFKYRAIMVSP